ncbi:MAG: hypothetical protein LBI14_09670 [Treponema sp.]|nr:hypothetical protein [Treponema sp.]
MFNIVSGEWIPDLETMTCRNYTWRITVSFEKQGEALIGKISNMPDNLIRRCLYTENGFMILKKVVKEAEDVFFMAYYDNILAQYTMPDDILRNLDFDFLAI